MFVKNVDTLMRKQSKILGVFTKTVEDLEANNDDLQAVVDGNKVVIENLEAQNNVAEKLMGQNDAVIKNIKEILK